METAIGKVFKRKKEGLFHTAFVVLCFLFCVDSAHAASTQTGVVANVAPDFSSSAISTISVDPEGGPRTVVNNLLASATSDILVKAYGALLLQAGEISGRQYNESLRERSEFPHLAVHDQ